MYWKLKGDKPKRGIAKHLKIEINIDSYVKEYKAFKSGVKFV